MPTALFYTRGRAATEARMTDICTISHDPAGTRDATLDPTTLALSAPNLSTVYTGKCRVGKIKRTRFQSPEELGGEVWRNVPHFARIPYSALAPAEGDLFVVTAVGPDGDPALAGRKFSIVEVGFTSENLARHLLLMASQDIADRAQFR